MTGLAGVGFMAVFAAVAAGWKQVKSFLVRFKSLFIITATITTRTLRNDLNGYLKDNYKKSKFGTYKFSTKSIYFKSEKKRKKVAYMMPSEAMTYWDGIKPLLVSQIRKEEGPDILTLTFIRGTFDIKKIIKNSIDRINELESSENKTDNRFRIIDFYGRYGDTSVSDLAEEDEGDMSLSELKNLELLGCTVDQIGQERPKNPFNSLYYGNDVNVFIKELDRWMGSKTWFNKRSLDWRIGILLKGLPGTGKSSFVKAVAQKYNLPIYRFDLISMSNEELSKSWRTALTTTPCICLFEDMDRLYDKDGNMINSDNMQTKGKLTTDSVLNCISGVDSANGVITMVTANYPERLPKALTREGRLDISLELGNLTPKGQLSMAWRIVGGVDIPKIITPSLEKMDKDIKTLIRDNKNVTGASFQLTCSKFALNNYWDR